MNTQPVYSEPWQYFRIRLSDLLKKIIGVLPASGSASRLGGIPKFCLPLNEDESLIQWHINHLSKICDQVHISTRKMWIPILHQMNLPKNCFIFELEPSTMSGAIKEMSTESNARYIIGMPDTYMPDSNGEFYTDLANSNSDVTLAAFPCHDQLIGRVGQILFNQDGDVLDVMDKVPSCEYEFLWGALALNGVSVDPLLATPSLQIMDWVREGKSVKALKAIGTYLDIGTVSAIKSLYRDIL
jgi:hypothetical protein